MVLRYCGLAKIRRGRRQTHDARLADQCWTSEADADHWFNEVESFLATIPANNGNGHKKVSAPDTLSVPAQPIQTEMPVGIIGTDGHITSETDAVLDDIFGRTSGTASAATSGRASRGTANSCTSCRSSRRPECAELYRWKRSTSDSVTCILQRCSTGPCGPWHTGDIFPCRVGGKFSVTPNGHTDSTNDPEQLEVWTAGSQTPIIRKNRPTQARHLSFTGIPIITMASTWASPTWRRTTTIP